MNPLKNEFLLDPQVVFLNHGSFGACPKPVFKKYRSWQRRLENQPVLFLAREYNQLMRQAREALGEYLHADPNDLIFIPNATHGVNILARSLYLDPGDEVLTSDHEYGACNNAWDFICQKNRVSYIHQHIPLQMRSPEETTELFWKGVTRHTKLIYLSHITSPTAQCFPIELICQKARQEGILTAIDGAHAPGQLELDLTTLEADFYFGNCHKWMLTPKGAGFLYARKELQTLLEPQVVSWGWSANENDTTGSRFVDLFQWTGTYDPSAVLAVPEAIKFMRKHHWPDVRSACHQLLSQALQRISSLTGLPVLYDLDHPERSSLPPQMGVVSLYKSTDMVKLKNNLYDRYKVEIPCIEWNGDKYLRISIQAYNDEADVEALVNALKNEILV
jgi:isopenicillin-N epimerase